MKSAYWSEKGTDAVENDDQVSVVTCTLAYPTNEKVKARVKRVKMEF